MVARFFALFPGTCLVALPEISYQTGPVDIGEQIRRARERANMSQEQLAALAGVALRTVGNWERGTTLPRSSLGRIVEILGDLDDEQTVEFDYLGGYQNFLAFATYSMSAGVDPVIVNEAVAAGSEMAYRLFKIKRAELPQTGDEDEEVTESQQGQGSAAGSRTGSKSGAPIAALPAEDWDALGAAARRVDPKFRSHDQQ